LRLEKRDERRKKGKGRENVWDTLNRNGKKRRERKMFAVPALLPPREGKEEGRAPTYTLLWGGGEKGGKE